MENERTMCVPDFSRKTWKEDVVLLVEGKELHVAKNVLAYISPVFEAMFSHPFSEKDKPEVELPGKEYESFLEFLRCVYPGPKRSITVDNIYNVLPLADEYQVSELKENCEEFLKQFVSKKTTTLHGLLKCLTVSERYHMREVKDICVDKIEGKQPVEIAEAKIDPICKDTMSEVMKRLVIRQQLELVKRYILESRNEAVGETEFENFTDAKGAIIDFESNDVYSKQSRNLLVVDSSTVVDFWNFKFSAFVKYHPVNNQNQFGAFLKVKPPENVSNWSCQVKGRLSLKNSLSKDMSFRIDHKFTDAESAWGFPRFVEMSELLDAKKGYIVGDKVRITAVFLANMPDVTVKDV